MSNVFLITFASLFIATLVLGFDSKLTKCKYCLYITVLKCIKILKDIEITHDTFLVIFCPPYVTNHFQITFFSKLYTLKCELLEDNLALKHNFFTFKIFELKFEKELKMFMEHFVEPPQCHVVFIRMPHKNNY